MKINGEAIYGTSKWSTMKEGPTSVEMKSTTYRKEHGFDTVFTHEDFWFTQKKNAIYIMSLTTPVNDKVKVKSLVEISRQIKSIKVLGNKGSLNWSVQGENVEIDFPPKMNTGKNGFVLKVGLK